MPELPEVETVRRQVAGALVGSRWTRITARPCSLFRTPAAELTRRLAGARLTGATRRGKVLLLGFDGDRTLLVHLGMSGQLLLAPPAAPGAGHRHLVVDLDDGRTLVLRDPRRFGYVKLVATSAAAGQPELAQVGADPLDPARNWEEFTRAFKARSGAVKPVLMTQSVFAGVGNVYADEILFRARVRPQRAAADLTAIELKELFHAVRAVLGEAIDLGGTSFDDAFTDLYGRPGLFGGRLRVYGRDGEPCPTCHTGLQPATIGGRSSVFCPHCQK